MHEKQPCNKKKRVASIHGGLNDELAVETPLKKIKIVEQTQNESVNRTLLDRSNIETPNLNQPTNSSAGFQKSSEISVIGKLF